MQYLDINSAQMSVDICDVLVDLVQMSTMECSSVRTGEYMFWHTKSSVEVHNNPWSVQWSELTGVGVKVHVKWKAEWMEVKCIAIPLWGCHGDAMKCYSASVSPNTTTHIFLQDVLLLLEIVTSNQLVSVHHVILIKLAQESEFSVAGEA